MGLAAILAVCAYGFIAGTAIWASGDAGLEGRDLWVRTRG